MGKYIKKTKMPFHDYDSLNKLIFKWVDNVKVVKE